MQVEQLDSTQSGVVGRTMQKAGKLAPLKVAIKATKVVAKPVIKTAKIAPGASAAMNKVAQATGTQDASAKKGRPRQEETGGDNYSNAI